MPQGIDHPARWRVTRRGQASLRLHDSASTPEPLSDAFAREFLVGLTPAAHVDFTRTGFQKRLPRDLDALTLARDHTYQNGAVFEPFRWWCGKSMVSCM